MWQTYCSTYICSINTQNGRIEHGIILQRIPYTRTLIQRIPWQTFMHAFNLTCQNTCLHTYRLTYSLRLTCINTHQISNMVSSRYSLICIGFPSQPLTLLFSAFPSPYPFSLPFPVSFFFPCVFFLQFSRQGLSEGLFKNIQSDHVRYTS